MAASSSSSSSNNVTPQMKYEVFLSFRGEETRNNFTSHLHAALCRKKIQTFIDNRLKRGDEISPSLLSAIESSAISVVIFSEGYGSSSWCLDELAKIIECRNKYGRIVIPIFYYVDPSDVRKLTGNFGHAFLKLQERFKVTELQRLQKWRAALMEAANLSGFVAEDTRVEALLTEEIVANILERLVDMFPSDDKEGLVGVQLKIWEIQRLLYLQSKIVWTLGIWGIGGIGKTTIAVAVFNKICRAFEGTYFSENVREGSEKIGGLSQLRRKLVSSLLEDGIVKSGVSNLGISFESKRLSRKKVLIVLDDVTCSEQIELLIGGVDLFAIGSRIIITTRDKQVLKSCRVNEIYEMKALEYDNALELFSRHAFSQNKLEEGYEELSNKVVNYACSVPLALKVLGHFLVGRDKDVWRSVISRMQKFPHKDIQKVLKISYDGLEDEEQSIFLDIACFFKGQDRDFVTKFLDACGFSAQIGITVLLDKALIVISDNEITMHDLLQEMGREIVRQESINNPEKRSRLWNHKDIFEVLTYNTGTEVIQGISFDMSKVKEIRLDPRTFKNMRKLRFLKFYGENKCRISHFKGHEVTEMRYLHWDGYPLRSLPSTIQLENIFSLQMHDSSINKLWDGFQELANLKQIDLKGSIQLTKLSSLSVAPNLESLILQGCTSLIEIDSSLQNLNKLVILDLRDCISLKSLPTILHLGSLKKLYLSGCLNLEKVPEISSSYLEELLLNGTAIEELPSSISCLSRLVILDIRECKMLESLPSSLCKLKSLQYLYLSGCSNLQTLPDNFGDLKALKELQAERIALRELPSSVVCLNNLVNLSFKGFRGQNLVGFLLPISLPFSGFCSLMTLNLSDCGIVELPECLGQLSSLKYLYLDKNYFERIPESIIHLSKLCKLSVSCCERLKSLPQLPDNLYQIDASHCMSLEALSHITILFAPRLSFESYVCNLLNCFKLEWFGLNETVREALMKLQLMATCKAGFSAMVHGQICYPGSEIPEWFSYLSMGSSLTLKIPLVFFDNDFVGIAFSSVVAFGNHHHNEQHFYVSIGSMLKTNESHEYGSNHPYCAILDRRFGIDYVGSDHVLLGYLFIQFFYSECLYNAELFLQFYLEDENRHRIDCCEVKKCGFHFFYAHEYSNSRFGFEEEDEPDPKHFKLW